jgi:hypothetical protein
MKYYLVPESLADRLNVKSFRHGSASVGYIITIGDLSTIGIDEAIREGAKEISEKNAIQFINNL